MRWFSWLAWWLEPPPMPQPPPALPEPTPLRRVFPPLSAEDHHLGLERVNAYEESEIEQALMALRGGLARDAPRIRVTRPARFRIATNHVSGFAQACLLVHAEGHIRVHDMYAGYMLWIGDAHQEPVSSADFDFAMADHLTQIGGIRDGRGYRGCRFRPDFLRRLDEITVKEAQHRLGAGLRELMAEKRSSGE